MKAVRDALGKLEDGRSREDAEAVCGPEVLQQIFKWKVVAYPRIFQFYEVLFFFFGYLKLVMKKVPFFFEILCWALPLTYPV